MHMELTTLSDLRKLIISGATRLSTLHSQLETLVQLDFPILPLFALLDLALAPTPFPPVFLFFSSLPILANHPSSLAKWIALLSVATSSHRYCRRSSIAQLSRT